MTSLKANYNNRVNIKNEISINNNSEKFSKLTTAKVAKAITTTVNNEQVKIENLSTSPVIENNNAGIYSEECKKLNQYGGNQGSLNDNAEKFIQDEKIWEIAENYYSDITAEDLELLFFRMNRVGCGYVAAINTILEEYLFHDELDFYARFGYPPYNLAINEETGKVYKDYNYEYLFLDFFLYYAKNYCDFETIEEVYGNAELEREVRNGDAALDEEEFTRTGVRGSYIDKVGAGMEQFLQEKGITVSVENARPVYEPGTEGWNEIASEFAEKGIEFDENTPLYKDLSDITTQDIRNMLNDGKQLIISANDFTLYYPEDVDGNGYFDDKYAEDIGGHAMTITGVTDDKVIVSSWGNEYLMDLDDILEMVSYDYGDFSNIDY